MEYRYKLDRTSKKVICPSCKETSFVLYVYADTKEYLPEQYGRCNRESNCNYLAVPPLETKCFYVPFETIKTYNEASYKISAKGSYHYLPKSQVYEVLSSGAYVSEFCLKGEKTENPPTFIESDVKYFHGFNNGSQKAPTAKPEPKPAHKIEFIPDRILSGTLKQYENNVFLNNLLKNIQYPFNASDISKAISLYYLGTIIKGDLKGAICFPFIDIDKKVRVIQVKQFDSKNHTIKTTFIHAIIKQHLKEKNISFPDWLNNYQNNEKFVSCLFGEHLLNKYPTNPIALVEAPKTAIYGTLYFGFPDNPKNYIWLSSYNLSSLTFDKCKILKGRKVMLFPDLSKDGKAFELWNTRAKEFEKELPNTIFKVSDLLERNATPEQRQNGFDLADFLIKLDWQTFRPQKHTPPQAETLPEPETINSNNTDYLFKQVSESWDKLSESMHNFWQPRGGKNGYIEYKIKALLFELNMNEKQNSLNN
jgi:hypothetical protein